MRQLFNGIIGLEAIEKEKLRYVCPQCGSPLWKCGYGYFHCEEHLKCRWKEKHYYQKSHSTGWAFGDAVRLYGRLKQVPGHYGRTH